MTRIAPSLLLAGLLLALVSPATAQQPTLADVARAEEARRKTLPPKTGKVLTNDDLRGNREDRPAVPAPAVAPVGDAAAPASGPASPADAKKAADATPEDPKKDQAYWHDRITAARQQLERSQMFATALESRINGLWAEFTAKDDPAQRANVERERQKSLAELERVKREIDEQTKAIAGIEDEARKLGVPPGWLR
jgi:hypothetical protein